MPMVADAPCLLLLNILFSLLTFEENEGHVAYLPACMGQEPGTVKLFLPFLYKHGK